MAFKSRIDETTSSPEGEEVAISFSFCEHLLPVGKIFKEILSDHNFQTCLKPEGEDEASGFYKNWKQGCLGPSWYQVTYHANAEDDNDDDGGDFGDNDEDDDWDETAGNHMIPDLSEACDVNVDYGLGLDYTGWFFFTGNPLKS